ncbi:MAG: FAD-dependent oxidoreductase [Pseudomonadales bacterium]|nr:FAD-dependent oxidoreductase [Pseudomonadales bacterium]
MSKIAIVGAGLLGRLLAWRLTLEHQKADSSIDVSLFDMSFDAGDSAAYVAAAMLAPLSELVHADQQVYQFGLQSLPIWQQWSDDLQQSGVDIGLLQAGSLVVAHHGDLGNYHYFTNALDQANANYQLLNHAQLRELEPSLAANFDYACFLPDEGSIDNRALLAGLLPVIQANGVSCIEKALPMLLDAQFVSQFDCVLDCRGFAAKQQLVAQSAPLRGVRGEVLRVHAPAVHIGRPVRLMHPRYQLYIAPKPDDIYVIGATEIESESEAEITIRSSMELLSALYSIDKGFAEAKVLEANAKCRPAFIDNHPAIIHDGKLVSVNGMYRHGFLLAPAVVHTVLNQLGFPQQLDWSSISHQMADLATG